MRHLSRTILSLIALVLAFGALSAVTAQAADKQGVVIQMSDNDPAKWNLALNVARNAQQALGANNVDVEIVAFGPGLNMLKFESEVGSRLAEAEKSGIALIACGNTMKGMKLTDKDLYAGVKVVPAGVIEIMKKQKQGWAYVRP